MDALILDLANVSEQLLPILGAVVLIFLCVLLKKAWEMIDSIHETIKDVEKSMEKLQAPLDTAVKYSHSLDKVHDKTSEVLQKATDFASENVTKIQSAVQEKFNKDEEEIVEEENHE